MERMSGAARISLRNLAEPRCPEFGYRRRGDNQFIVKKAPCMTLLKSALCPEHENYLCKTDFKFVDRHASL